MPVTVQAVLAARIDRLPAEAKSILNAASVIGTRFDVDTLRALLPESASAHLAELVSAELIDQTEFVPRQRYCFRHPLVRTVAYESQLSTTRVQAHRRLAAAIEARTAGAADENAALIATHLEGAGEFAEAYRWHMRAAGWLRPRDLPAARAQWESALEIADRLPEERYDAIAMQIAPLTMLISTMLYVGDDAAIDERYSRLRDLAAKTADLKSLAIATAGRIQSFTVNEYRVPDAALLSAELEDIVGRLDCEAADKKRDPQCGGDGAVGQLPVRRCATRSRGTARVASRGANGRSRAGQRNSRIHRGLPSATTRRAGCTCSRRSGKRAHSRPFCTHRCCSSRVRLPR